MTLHPVNSLSLCVQERGDGDPLLLIMGIGSQMILWPPGFIDGLVTAGFRVIWFDNRDVGESTRLDHLGHPSLARALTQRLLRRTVDAPYTLDDMAADAVGVLDALGIDRAHVVGASMGGMIAQLVALNAPRRVRSLTSIMATSGALMTGLPSPRVVTQLLRTADPGEEAHVARALAFFAAAGGRGFPFNAAGVEAYAREAWRRGPTSPAGFARHAVAIVASPDRTRRLGTLNLPAAVIHGGADPLVPPAAGRAVALAIPGASHLEIPGMGHDLPEAAWPQMIQAIVAARGRTHETRAGNAHAEATARR